MSDILDSFIASYSSGAQGCEMDCDTAQEVALAITALRARLEAVEKERDEARDNSVADFMKLLDARRRAERAEAALATARRDALREAAKVAETAMQKHAKAHYSGEAVRVFRNGDDTLSESAAKTYCAGEILEAIRALANEAETSARGMP